MKDIYLGSSNIETLRVLHATLEYVKEHPGVIPSLMFLIDEARITLDDSDNYDLDKLTLRSGQIDIELEHSHNTWCFDSSGQNCNLDKTMLLTRKV